VIGIIDYNVCMYDYLKKNICWHGMAWHGGVKKKCSYNTKEKKVLSQKKNKKKKTFVYIYSISLLTSIPRKIESRTAVRSARIALISF